MTKTVSPQAQAPRQGEGQERMPLEFAIGQSVKWYGQSGEVSGEIKRITYPQPSNCVLWIGDDLFPINATWVIATERAK